MKRIKYIIAMVAIASPVAAIAHQGDAVLSTVVPSPDRAAIFLTGPGEVPEELRILTATRSGFTGMSSGSGRIVCPVVPTCIPGDRDC